MNDKEQKTKVKIPIEEKRKRIYELGEDKFHRDIIRTLFISLGYDMSTLQDDAKESVNNVFTETDKLKRTRILVTHTNKGKINMADAALENVGNLANRLRTIATTPHKIPGSNKKKRPDEVILCTSGSINDNAKNHITHKLQGFNIRFLDGEEIIHLIDENCPELWLGITADTFQYYDAIKKRVETVSADDVISPLVSDEQYVSLKLSRLSREKMGKSQEPDTEELDVKGIVHSSSDVFIVADAGTGKSTLLQRIAYQIARKPLSNKHVLPLVIKASEIPKNSQSIANFISFCERTMQDISSTNTLTKTNFKNGNICLMADAFDEIAKTTERVNSLKFLLQEVKSEFPDLRFICTSRPDAIDEINDETDFFKSAYNLEPLSINQTKKILVKALSRKSLSTSDEAIIVERAQGVLKWMNSICGFELTPLLVTVFAWSEEIESKDIPANVTELFKKFTELMLNRWDREKGFRFQYQYPVKDVLLKKVAYTMHEAGLTGMLEEKFREMIAEEMQSWGYEADIEIIIDELIHRSRLLMLNKGVVSFSHLLFQEFFTGRHIRSSKEISQNKLKDSWWTRAIVFHFGDNPDIIDKLASLQEKARSTLEANRCIGLSLQACYLSNKEKRLSIWKNMISDFETLIHNKKDGLFPFFSLFHIITYIKDALPLRLLGSDFDIHSFWPEWNNSLTKKFLVLSALRESGVLGKNSKIGEGDLTLNEPLLRLVFYIDVYIEYRINKKESLKQLFLRMKKMIQPGDYRIFNSEIHEILKDSRDAQDERKRIT